MKYDGMVEKSVMPSIGVLIRMPFHVTCVWPGDVPRNVTVDSVARPWLLTNTEELNVSMSAIDSATFSFSAAESMAVFCTPISFIGRRPHTMASCSRCTRRVSCPWAAGMTAAATAIAMNIRLVIVAASRMRRG